MEKERKIYKYVIPERIDILENLQMRITQRKYLNDIFDQFISFKKIISEELYNQHFSPRFNNAIQNLPLDDYIKRSYKKIINNSYKALLTENSLEVIKYVNEMYNKEFGVLCFTKSPDNVPMWAHYSNLYKGFVIIFNSDHSFFNKGLVDDPQAGYLCNVDYVEEKKSFESLVELKNNPNKLFFEKHKSWEYENEWRMILPLKKATIKKDPDIYLISIPDDLISGIIFGMNTDTKLIETVKELKKNKINHLKLYRALPNFNEYKMDIVKLNNE